MHTTRHSHSRGRRFQLLLITGTVFVASLTVVALGNANTSRRGTDTQSAAGPVRGGTLVVGRTSDIFGFDPPATPDCTSIFTELQIYDRLVRLAPDGKHVAPELATKWRITNGGRTAFFTIRSGVKFSDGSPLTVDDVVFSIQRALTPKNTYAVLFGQPGAIKSATKVNANTVRLTLKRPFAPLLTTLATFAGSIYSKANVKKWGKDVVNHPLGSGAFALERWDKGSQIILTRNRYYWQNGKPYLD
jgi:peptide/nickel transport system substrate-binding protein